ncbi:hypothetical protein GC176_21565 [bacterium]|nr:hypothetical protein [bacterium]
MSQPCRSPLAPALLVLAVVLTGRTPDDLLTSAAQSAPYTVRSDVEHPFDPDWPDVQLILAQKCNGCHRPGTDQTDLTNWETFIDAMSEDERLIVPGNPEASKLYQVVSWNHSESLDSKADATPRMPYDETEWLTGGQLETLARWIRNGALKYRLPETCSTRPLLEIDFPSAKECRACHPKQYEEWSRSMHAYAQHSPIFEAFNLTLQERTSGTIGTFCSRCHTPLGTALGENGQRRNVNRSRLSMEGVTCVVCHRMERPYYKANTRRHIAPGRLSEVCMYGPFSDAVSLSENSHGSQQLVSIRSSAFCGACHDVTSPQGIRLEEAFSEWQNSPAARRQLTCQHCHMGPVQGIPTLEEDRPLGYAAMAPVGNGETFATAKRPLSDHTFSGPDYSILPDTEFPEKLDWMYEKDYRQTDLLTEHEKRSLNDLRRRNRRQLRIAQEKRYELLKNGAELCVDVPNCAECGGRFNVAVAVRSRFDGHNFPTGFTEERQFWVSVEVCDPAGHCVFSSGTFDANFDLRDEHSHAVEAGEASWDADLLNFQSKFVALTNRGTERSVILSVNRHLTPLNFLRPADSPVAAFGRHSSFRISKGSLPPLSTVNRDYAVRLPKTPGDYHVRVRLNYRHIPPHLMDEIGAPHLKHLLETVVLDEFESTLNVQPRSGGLFRR